MQIKAKSAAFCLHNRDNNKLINCPYKLSKIVIFLILLLNYINLIYKIVIIRKFYNTKSTFFQEFSEKVNNILIFLFI